MKNRFFLVIMAIVLVAAFMTGACSRTKTIKTDGGEITLSEGGGVVKIEGKEGKVVASFGDSAQLPGNLSKDVPVYKPANVTMSQVLGDGEKVMLGLQTKDDSATVAKFYSKELADKGWQIKNVMNMGPTRMLQAMKGSQKINVTINTDGSETNISLAYSGK